MRMIVVVLTICRGEYARIWFCSWLKIKVKRGEFLMNYILFPAVAAIAAMVIVGVIMKIKGDKDKKDK
jgi:hypothetical protein